jgi:SH3-like domain-containing protein
MTITAPGSLFRVLLCGMLVIAPEAMGQIPSAQTPATKTQATKAPTKTEVTKPPTKSKPTPVVQPHGVTHAQKPPAKPPAAAAPPSPPPAPVPAEPPKPPEEEAAKGSNTGLPLPRFAALRSDEVNLRAGPGTRYPIEWIYKRRELPVEIEREFEVWRLIRDPDGVKGWVHQATLTGRRSFIVIGGDATLRREAQDTASAVAVLKPGVIGHIRSCVTASDWCQVQAGDYRGYLKRGQFWGTTPGEIVAN